MNNVEIEFDRVIDTNGRQVLPGDIVRVWHCNDATTGRECLMHKLVMRGNDKGELDRNGNRLYGVDITDIYITGSLCEAHKCRLIHLLDILLLDCEVIDGVFRGKAWYERPLHSSYALPGRAMDIVALGGFCDPWITSIARDLAPLNPITIAAPRWGNNWREGDSRKITKKLPERFVACGFSDGAPIALELAGWHPGCVGLIYISGLGRSLHASIWSGLSLWSDFPALCMYTAGEKRALAQGTTGVWCSLSDAGLDATLRIARPSKGPSRFKRRFPHFSGVGHHVEAIKQWMETTY